MNILQPQTTPPEVVFQAKTRDGDSWSVVSEADYRRYSKNPDYVVRMVFKEKYHEPPAF